MQILCVQLKRFRHDSYFSSKLNTPVEFPLSGLDLRHFIHRDFIGAHAGATTEYDLMGVVNHRGSFNGGHYVAYCRNLATDNWLEFDDCQVRNVHEEEVASVSAYLLFYMRRLDVAESAMRSRLVAETLASAAGATGTVYVSKQWFNRLVCFGQPGPVDSFDVLCPHGSTRDLLCVM